LSKDVKYKRTVNVFLNGQRNTRCALCIENAGGVKCKQRIRPENLATTDHFGDIRISYGDNNKLVFNKWITNLLTGLPGTPKKLVSVSSECGGQPSLPRKETSSL
jgi:hypothetical protein